MALNKYTDAEDLYHRLIAQNERDVDARWQYIACLELEHRNEDARDDLLGLAEVRPDDARVFRELGMLYRNAFHDEFYARALFMKSLQLDPNQMDLRSLLTDSSTQSRPAMPTPIQLPKVPHFFGPASSASTPSLP